MNFFKKIFRTDHEENDRVLAKLSDRLTQDIEDVNAPESLSPGAIADAIKGKKQVRFLARYQRIAVAAASVVLISAIVAGVVITRPDKAPIVTAEVPSSSVDVSVDVSSEEIIPESSEEAPSIEPPLPSSAAPVKKPDPLPERLENVYANSYEKIYMVLAPLKGTVHDRYATAGGSTSKAAMVPAAPGDDAPDIDDGNATYSPDSESDYGQTNTQVDNVDESDILKNDGKYLYALSRTENDPTSNSVVSIIKASSDGKMTLVSKIKIKYDDFTASEMYVYRNRLIITGSVRVKMPSQTGSKTDGTSNDGTAAVYCCEEIYYGGYDSRVLIYDIKDRAKPVLTRTFTQQGNGLQTRMIGNKLYIITTYYTGSLNKLTRENIADYVPATVDSRFGRALVPASRIALFPDVKSASFAVVTRLNVENDSEKPVSEAVMGAGSNIYSSTSGLYLASERYGESNDQPGIYTSLLRFRIGDTLLQCEASGRVEGTILNQFSMDEFDKHFRIVTTAWSTQKRTNDLYVLDSNLKQTGKISDIAPGESVKSVRFMGKKGYVVTFLQVDPLFAIDLSNPKKPKIAGQLKIPGFSSYLHPISEKLLLGIGEENSRVKLSLFDVSDMTKPKETHNMILSADGYWSQTTAAYDHKAVMFDKVRGLLALPYCYNSNTSFFGMVIVKADEKSGFKEIAKITHNIPVVTKYSRENEYQANNDLDGIKRSTYTGNTFFTMSDSMIISMDSRSWKKHGEINLFEKEPLRDIFVCVKNGAIEPNKRDVPTIWR